MLQWIPGVGSVDDAARGEKANLDGTRQSFDGKYDLGDRIRGFLGGYSQEDVRRRAAELKRADIDRALSTERTKAGMALEGTGIKGGGNKIGEGQTVEDFQSSLMRDTATGTLAQQYLSMDGASIGDLSSTDTAATIRNKASALRRKNKLAEEGKVLEERIRQETRADNLKAEADRRYYGDRAEQRLANAEAAQLTHQRGLIELAQTKQRDAYEMQKYQHELEYRKQNAREKRTSSLIQALAGLGAAFAI